MLTSKMTLRHVGCVSLCAIMSCSFAGNASAKKAPKDYSPLAFDVTKRKKTKSRLTDRWSWSGYTSLRFQGEKNLLLDDGATDKIDEPAAFLGFVLRGQLSDRVTAFAHAEIDLRQKTTLTRSYSVSKHINIKEALLSFKLPGQSSLTVGRMRFTDEQKRMVDASVDGVHFVTKTEGKAFEAALVKDVFNDRGDYFLLHGTKFSGPNSMGIYTLGESTGRNRRLHIATYINKKPSDRFNYSISAMGVIGDAANGRSSGFGFDARGTLKIGQGKMKPQLTFGLAAGSDGFLQSGLHSNKTYDGGQTQFHRYGYVFQPELTNLVVANIALGLRPSRNFSVDLAAHFYMQLNPSSVAPVARVTGSTNGNSAFVGTDISLAGAWRPSKKTKFEFGVGVFNAGSAYTNRSSAKRVYLRLSTYF